MTVYSLKNIFKRISFEDFIDKYWSEHYYLEVGDKTRFDDLLTIDQLDYILSAQFHDDLKVIKDGKIITSQNYQSKYNASHLFQYFQQGCTLLLIDLNKNWLPLKNFCFAINEELKFAKRIYANVYLTPANSRALPRHADLQDVFILQIYGSKNWKLYSQSYYYPTTDAQLKRHSEQINRGELTLDKTLNAGDLLYIPRGLIHEVSTNDETSIHITLTIEPYTNLDIIKEFLENYANESESLRKHVSIDYFKDPKLYHKNLLTELTNTLSAVKDDLLFREGEGSNVHLNLRNHLLDIEQLKFLNEDSIVFKRNHFPYNITIDNDEARISTSTELIEIEGARREIEFIEKNHSFAIQDIEGESSMDEKIELAKSLVELGILRIEKM